MSLAQYARFLMVGGFVALITVGTREVIGLLLAADTTRHFSISVAVAYAVGITLSYLLNHRFTFRSSAGSRHWRKLLAFVGIACVGLVCTWLLSVTIRYGTPLTAAVGKYSAAIAFSLAALLSSILTYPLNAILVFNAKTSSAG